MVFKRNVPKRYRPKAKKQTKTRNFVRSNRVALQSNRRSTGSGINWLSLCRVAITCLPLQPTVYPIFDIVFNFIEKVVTVGRDNVNVNTGAYALFEISPAALLYNSPLLAKLDNGNYSFPGHPVRMKYVNIKVINTSKRSERSGRWAAVFIPYIEEHDSKRYPTSLHEITYQELVAMPYSRSGGADKLLNLNYKMNDQVAYCARPREIDENIGLVLIVWDSSSKADEAPGSANMPNEVFNCEIELRGGCIPHVVLGPQHRVEKDSSTFNIKSLTTGLTRRHYVDGKIEFCERDFEMI